MKSLVQYVGPQSYWNQHAINRREKYYYGFGGYESCLSRRPSAWQNLQPKRIACDALTEDCWKNVRHVKDDGLPMCIELFDGDSSKSSTVTFLGLLGGVALAFYLASARK